MKCAAWAVAILMALVGQPAYAQSTDDIFASVFGDQAEEASQTIVIPVIVDGRDAGDVTADVNLGKGSASFDARSLVDILFPYVDPLVTQAIADQADADLRIDLEGLDAAGLIARFDPGGLTLVLSVPADLRPEVEIALGGRRPGGGGDEIIGPADFSAYMNLFSGIDLVHTDSGGGAGSVGRQPVSVALDGAMAFDNFAFQGEAFYEEDGLRRWRRGNLRLVHDDEVTAVRTSFGDLNYPTTGFQSFVSMGGISLVRDYDIQPYRTTRPSGRSSFVLENDSQVEVIVNDRVVDRLDLLAGPYQLSELPIASGANDVVLRIRDSFGREEEIVFQQFFDGSLLTPGLDEFGIAAGYPSTVENDIVRYDTSLPSLTGFYREGITQELTLGINGQGNRDSTMAGGELRIATSLGNFLVEPATSWVRGSGIDGAINLEFEQFQPLGDLFPGDRLWNLQALYRGEDFGDLGTTSPRNPVSLQLSGRMSQLLDDDHALAIGARYGFSRQADRADTENFNILLRRRLWSGASMDVTFERDRDSEGLVTTTGFLSLRLSLGGGYSTRLTFDTDGRAWETALQYQPEDPIGAIAAEVEVDRSAQSHGVSADLDYRDPRFLASYSYEADNPRGDSGDRMRSSTLNFSTALVFADGWTTLSRPVTDSFAIVVPHENMEELTVGVNPYGGGYFSEVDWLGPAVIPSVRSYEYDTLVIEVPDLPFGYDIGDETPTVRTTLNAGAIVTVGTDATVLLGGTLQDNLGNGIGLEAGELLALDEPDAVPITFFTNRNGKFRIDGVSPGSYAMRLYAYPKVELAIDVPADAEGLYDIGTTVMPNL